MSRSYTPVRRIGWSFAWVALVWAAIQINAAPGTLAMVRAGEGATVRGVAWNSDNTPIPSAKVRLRNTHSGRVEANAATGEDGRFAFTAVEGGPYVVELVGDNGKVLAVGQSFRVETGETVATFVRLAPRRSWLTDVLSNASTGVIAAAASAGVAARGPSGTGLTPGTTGSRPISPQ